MESRSSRYASNGRASTSKHPYGSNKSKKTQFEGSWSAGSISSASSWSHRRNDRRILNSDNNSRHQEKPSSVWNGSSSSYGSGWWPQKQTDISRSSVPEFTSRRRLQSDRAWNNPSYGCYNGANTMPYLEPAASRTKPKVAVVGHSFVRRFKDRLDQERRSYKQQLEVSHCVDSITMYGKGGAFADQILSNFEPVSTDILILDLGTNDLCGSLDGKTLATKVCAYIEDYLRKFPNLQRVFIFEIVERDRTRNVPKGKFDYERGIYNRKIQDAANFNSKIYFCKHTGLSDIKKWSNDGIHPNTRFGTTQYLKNVKNTILTAVDSIY